MSVVLYCLALPNTAQRLSSHHVCLLSFVAWQIRKPPCRLADVWCTLFLFLIYCPALANTAASSFRCIIRVPQCLLANVPRESCCLFSIVCCLESVAWYMRVPLCHLPDLQSPDVPLMLPVVSWCTPVVDVPCILSAVRWCTPHVDVPLTLTVVRFCYPTLGRTVSSSCRCIMWVMLSASVVRSCCPVLASNTV